MDDLSKFMKKCDKGWKEAKSCIGSYENRKKARIKDKIMKTLSEVQKEVNQLPEELRGLISDGYHTFDELYEFRMLYNAMFANLLAEGVGVGAIWQEIDVYKSLRHDDGQLCFGGGWFVVVIKLMTGKQISNHYPIANWDLFHIPERHSVINFDGHTSADVVERIREFLK